MALRYVEYKRRQWVLRFRDPWSGKQRVRSFFAEAEAKAFEAIQAELYARERELIRRARRRTSSASATRATVAELLGRYMETLENPTTRSTTAQHIEPLTAIFGHRRAHCLTCDDVLAWCEVQRQRGVGQSTVHRRVSILRTAYSWAVRMRVLTGNPLMALRIAKPATRRITPPSTKEARLLYEVAAPHIRRVIVLGMATGARIGPSELFRLKWSDVDIETGIIRMPNAHKGALDEARDVPIRDDVLALLRGWQGEDTRIGCEYVIAYKGRPVRSISSGWHNALKRAGITRRIRPYDLRHAFASLALMHGADIKSVAETMGHRGITMLLTVYQHTRFDQCRRAVNAAPGLFSSSGAKKERKKRISGSGGGAANSPTGSASYRRTTAPHDTDISCGVSACGYAHDERVNAYQDGCGGAREGQSKNEGSTRQRNQVRTLQQDAGQRDGP